MFKRFLFTLIVVLFASHAAFAAVDQLQDFMVGTTNSINLVHGDQSANAIQNVFVGENQNATENTAAWAHQGYTGILHQIGSANGNSALVLVDQLFEVGGAQGQLVIGHTGPMLQTQNMSLFAGTALFRADGGGGGTANTMYVGNMSQSQDNVGGMMSEATNIAVQQHGDIQGQPGSAGSVVSTMAISTSQTQTIIP